MTYDIKDGYLLIVIENEIVATVKYDTIQKFVIKSDREIKLITDNGEVNYKKGWV